MPTPRIDANILIRYLTDEPPQQFDRDLDRIPGITRLEPQ